MYEYGKLVFHVIFGLVGDWHESEDLTQDTFLQALRALEAAQAASGAHFQPKAWLMRIAVNTVKWGTHDPFGSSETGRHISQLLSYSEFHAIQGAGHLPWLSNLAECGHLIRDFLAHHAGPATDRDLSTN